MKNITKVYIIQTSLFQNNKYMRFNRRIRYMYLLFPVIEN